MIQFASSTNSHLPALLKWFSVKMRLFNLYCHGRRLRPSLFLISLGPLTQGGNGHVHIYLVWTLVNWKHQDAVKQRKVELKKMKRGPIWISGHHSLIKLRDSLGKQHRQASIYSPLLKHPNIQVFSQHPPLPGLVPGSSSEVTDWYETNCQGRKEGEEQVRRVPPDRSLNPEAERSHDVLTLTQEP